MPTMTIIYCEPSRPQSEIEAEVESETDLITSLDAIRHKYLRELDHPIAVDLVTTQGDYLSVGLGDNESIVIYFPCEGHGQSFTSLGDGTAKGTAIYYFTQWTELSRKYVIPWEKAEKVILHWFRTGERSSDIQWTTQLFPVSTTNDE